AVICNCALGCDRECAVCCYCECGALCDCERRAENTFRIVGAGNFELTVNREAAVYSHLNADDVALGAKVVVGCDRSGNIGCAVEAELGLYACLTESEHCIARCEIDSRGAVVADYLDATAVCCGFFCRENAACLNCNRAV